MKKNLSKILIIFILNSFLALSAVEAANNNDAISKIENEIYGFDYTKDSNQNRIERLEQTVYGKIFHGDITKRIKKLSDDISADVIGLEISPKEDTFMEDDSNVENLAKEDSTVNYPLVDEIEMKLFNKTYKERDFHTRIVTIERKLFGKIYDVDDYSTRMDRIKAEILPNTLAKTNRHDYYDDDAFQNEDLSGINTSRFNFSMPFGQKNYTRPYANYGDMTGAAIPHTGIPINTNLNDELSQLEYETFGTEFSNEDTSTRIKRLNSVNKARKSSHKYDSQKFSQRMSTAMEIGAMILMILAMVL